MTFPKVIYFCNKTLEKMEKYANNWKVLNPEYEIRLFDDKMCENFLLDYFGDLYKEIFLFIPDGPIRADFWRICILYLYGGVYSDIDNEPIVCIDDFTEKDVDIVTCSSYMGDMKYNPNFIIADKKNIVLKKCIDWYLRKYIEKIPYVYWDWSIMQAFTDVLQLENYERMEGVYYSNDSLKVQIIKECPGNGHCDAHNIYNNIRLFNNRYKEWDSHNHCFLPSA
jgi:mannosyltransferase OCH1-like enzyme